MSEAGAGGMIRETTQLHVVGDLGFGVGTNTFARRQPGREPVRDTGKYVLAYCRQADGIW